MGWKLSESVEQLSFHNEDLKAPVLSFSVTKNTLTIQCTNEGSKLMAENISGAAGNKKFLKCHIGDNKFVIKDKFCAEHAILTINKISYITRAQRWKITRARKYSNLFYTERQAGDTAIMLATTYGFEKGYAYAEKELKRTNGESRCLEQLAEYSPEYANLVAAKKASLTINPVLWLANFTPFTTAPSIKQEPEIPEEYVCPLTLEIMESPVVFTCDGHTYEESAIRQWLSKNCSSPMTGQVFPPIQNMDMVLLKNEELALKINQFKQKNPLAGKEEENRPESSSATTRFKPA